MSQNMKKMDLTAYIGKPIVCACGRTHESEVQILDLARGALGRVAEHIRTLQKNTIFLVADTNTWKAAGATVEAQLQKSGICCRKHIFHREGDLMPDERAIGELQMAFPPDTDLVLAVGSGTIGDLCKVVSFQNKIDYLTVATAPSMDGFASTGAALTLQGLKQTVEQHGPIGVIGDTDVLAQAPMEMITAGLGDTLGKYTCLLDWKLAKEITGDYYCETVVSMVRTSLAACREHAEGLKQRDPEAVEAVMQALVLTGLAMRFVGNTRPASGGEHHLSHFWEMRYQMAGRKPVLHGTKVGLGLIAMLFLYHELEQEEIDFAAARGYTPDPVAWEADMRRTYLQVADGVIELEKKAQKNNLAERNERLQVIEEKWPEIRRLIRTELPTTEEMETLLLSLDAPANPEQIGLSEALVEDAVCVAKEVRDRYTLLQLLWDLHLAKPYAKKTAAYFTNGQQTYQAYQRQKTKAVLQQTRCFVLDMDGTIYLGDELFPFTKPFLKKVQESGKKALFFTNNSSKNKRDYLEKLARMGIPTEPDELLTSTEVILRHLQTEHPGAACYVVGTPSLREALAEGGVKLVETDPDIVILGFDTTLTYEKLDAASRFLEAGALYYGVHPDLVCPVEGKHKMPDCGAMAALLEATTGQTPRYFGKPARETVSYIVETTGFREEEIAFVGDRMYTDIAVAEGTRAISILVLTGETSREDLAGYSYAPDLVVDSLEKLTEV